MPATDLDVTGTPEEKMLLMLNEKVDALTDYVRSNKPSIPWAPDGQDDLWAVRYPGDDTKYVSQQPDVEEYNRKNWKVYRLTVPSRPDLKPNYEIRVGWDERAPTRQAYVLYPRVVFETMTEPWKTDTSRQGAWLAVDSELLSP